jgi:energy-coupling factor transporter ATP-binding protein EcfA2
MSEIIAIVGQTGTGKSTSVESLNPKETVIIGIVNKPLPFKGWKKNYNGEYKNYLISHDSAKIVETLKWVSEKRPEIKQIIIDDFQYIMSTEFMERANEQGWQKFTDIGKHVWDVIHAAKSLREDLKVVFLTHDEFILENYEPKRKIKTIGKLLDEKVTLEGLFTVVLFTDVTKNKEEQKLDYRFITQNDGTTTCKSPRGMFEELTIPNDLSFVLKSINEYNEG